MYLAEYSVDGKLKKRLFFTLSGINSFLKKYGISTMFEKNIITFSGASFFVRRIF